MGILTLVHKTPGYAIVSKERNVVLEITTKITGYTCLRILGDISGLKPFNKSIVVPTYELIAMREDETRIATYNVTRDAWFCRGKSKGLVKILENVGLEAYEFSNRCFEPAYDGILYNTVGQENYPSRTTLEAYALRQNGSEFLEALAHTEEMQTFTNITEIPEGKREPLNMAKDVMIHIGGWYHTDRGGRLAASLGCFGLTPKRHIKSERKDAVKDSIERRYEIFPSGNEDYRQAINFIKNACYPLTPKVLIKKREKVKPYQTIYQRVDNNVSSEV